MSGTMQSSGRSSTTDAVLRARHPLLHIPSMVTPIEDGTALEAHQARPARRIATPTSDATNTARSSRGILNCRSRHRCDRAIHGEEVNSEAHTFGWLDSMENSGGYRLRRVRAQQDVDIRLAGKHKAKAALTDPKHSPRSVTDAV